MRLLIIGCPHSGTMFTAEVLRAAGVSCGHEATYTLWGRMPAVADLVAEVSWEAVFHLDLGTVGSRVVVAHQTRDPIAWLNSWTRMSEHAGDAAWALLESNYPGIFARQKRDPARTAMWLWVEMNRRCERHTSLRHRVEDLRGEQGIVILDGLCRAARIDLDLDLARAALAAIDRSTNHHPGLLSHVPQTWETLPQGPERAEFKDLSLLYGYG
jgi:hypothetical protein